MNIGCPSDWYTAFEDSYLSTICNNLTLNPCNFTCCHSPKSQLYSRSKSCKILQHTDNSVPCGHISDAWTCDVINSVRRSHMKGQTWSHYFSLSNVWWWEVIAIQPCECLVFFRCVWFNSTYVGFNQPPIITSIVYLDTSANMWELGAWGTHLIWCTWRFLNHNKELASAI
jgi:hypothetical protein